MSMEEITLKKTELHQDRKSAEKQWNSLCAIITSLENRLSSATRRISELEKELKSVDRQEIDALYSENERLTNLLEED